MLSTHSENKPGHRGFPAPIYTLEYVYIDLIQRVIKGSPLTFSIPQLLL